MVIIANRTLEVSPVVDTYWRFAAERQAIYERRVAGLPGPWTDDEILRTHRFTNCYRASDRVSQFLIRHVIYEGSQAPEEVLFRTLVFKLFNRESTWNLLSEQLGKLEWRTFDFETYNRVLTEAFESEQRLYSAAYVMPSPKLGEVRKHSNHLRLIELMLNDDLSEQIQHASDLEMAFEILRSYPSLGDFLAFQYLIDINYSEMTSFDEKDFVVAGPGAKDGIRKCFGPGSIGIESEIINYMVVNQRAEFERLCLEFNGLKGRALQPIDCQNLFCEVDKYSRVAHPEIQGKSGRSRIKQKFHESAVPAEPWFPPKWGLN